MQPNVEFTRLSIQYQHSGNVELIDHLKTLFDFRVGAEVGPMGAGFRLVLFGFGLSFAFDTWDGWAATLSLYGLGADIDISSGHFYGGADHDELDEIIDGLGVPARNLGSRNDDVVVGVPPTQYSSSSSDPSNTTPGDVPATVDLTKKAETPRDPNRLTYCIKHNRECPPRC